MEGELLEFKFSFSLSKFSYKHKKSIIPSNSKFLESISRKEYLPLLKLVHIARRQMFTEWQLIKKQTDFRKILFFFKHNSPNTVNYCMNVCI